MNINYLLIVSSGLNGRGQVEIWFDVSPKTMLGTFRKFAAQSLLFDIRLKLSQFANGSAVSGRHLVDSQPSFVPHVLLNQFEIEEDFPMETEYQIVQSVLYYGSQYTKLEGTNLKSTRICDVYISNLPSDGPTKRGRVKPTKT